ncbi:MAG TPA: hypothetical protein PLW74_02710 [Candidatus Dojkabacteria bacterium]|nr:hypothetical protein [Candidatus Dojkabacteria bacterium]
MKNKTMDKIEKLELEYDDWKRGLSLGSREIHIIIGVVLKVNEIIDVLNSWVFEPTLTIPSQSQKQLKSKKNIEWKDGDILTTMDKNGITHNFILNDMANLGKQNEKEKEELNLKLREALKKDFKELYVKEYTTGWKEQRFLRNTELNIMSLENTKKYINSLILTKLFKKNKWEK